MATAFSLCYSVTLNFSDNGIAAPVSRSRANLSFVSRSLSPMSLTSRKGPTSSFTAKLADNETSAAVALSESETEKPMPVSDAAVETGETKREEVFAVVMVGSRQYIVFPGRYIYTQRLKGANVNDKITLNKVLLVGTKARTYIGKPIVANATVKAVVEEQTLDKKVIVFKYKKKKNYRRNIGHRQPITRIRVTSINGYQNSPSVTLE